MNHVVALCSVERKNSADQIEIVEPGHVFTIGDDEMKRLVSLRAVRPADEAEVALFEKQNRTRVSDADPVDEGAEDESKPAKAKGKAKTRRGGDL